MKYLFGVLNVDMHHHDISQCFVIACQNGCVNIIEHIVKNTSNKIIGCEIEECPICMNNVSSIITDYNHQLCTDCYHKMNNICHMCRNNVETYFDIDCE